jgi:hypothetical protein
MASQEITDQLRRIDAAENLAARTGELTEEWSSAGVRVEAIEPILRFMEERPGADFGMPGALVHFVERFHSQGYEERLAALPLVHRSDDESLSGDRAKILFRFLDRVGNLRIWSAQQGGYLYVGL